MDNYYNLVPISVPIPQDRWALASMTFPTVKRTSVAHESRSCLVAKPHLGLIAFNLIQICAHQPFCVAESSDGLAQKLGPTVGLLALPHPAK